MSSILAQAAESRENQALMIMTMEKKLNNQSPHMFRYLKRQDKSLSKISVAQYWDFLTYIDDDYLTDYEVVKMKELYCWQL